MIVLQLGHWSMILIKALAASFISFNSIVVMSVDYVIGQPMSWQNQSEYGVGDVWVNVVPEIIRTIICNEQIVMN